MNAIQPLSQPEQTRLHELESVIRQDIPAFLRVGSALLEIRDSRLYRGTHATFADYTSERWSITHRRANQLIRAYDVCHSLGTMVPRPDPSCPDNDPCCPIPQNERQVRPLVSLPKETQASAWKEACDRSNGKLPTAKTVHEVATKALGKCIVNGVEREDTAEVAAGRANGKIPHDAVVEVTIPEVDEDPVQAAREAIAERDAIQAEIPDDEWVKTFPLYNQIIDHCRKTFVDDAIFWRHIEDARKTFAYHVARAFTKARKPGAYAWRTKSYLGIKSPADWILCAKPEDGGCNGTGRVHLVGQCPKCRGRGYWIL